MTQRAVTQMKRIFARTKKEEEEEPSSLPSPGATGCSPLSLPRASLLSAWKCATCSKSFRERLKFVGRSSDLAAPLHSALWRQWLERAGMQTRRGCEQEIRFQGYLGIAARSHRLPSVTGWRLLTPSLFNRIVASFLFFFNHFPERLILRVIGYIGWLCRIIGQRDWLKKKEEKRGKCLNIRWNSLQMSRSQFWKDRIVKVSRRIVSERLNVLYLWWDA